MADIGPPAMADIEPPAMADIEPSAMRIYRTVGRCRYRAVAVLMGQNEGIARGGTDSRPGPWQVDQQY